MPTQRSTMKKSFFVLMAIMTFSSTHAQQWKPLFDGQTLKGWHLFKKKDTQPAWVVKDGAIFLDVSGPKEGRGDLVTDEVFGDFELKFEWKIGAGSNSGLILFVQENDKVDATWHTGPEFQLIDNTGYPDKLKPGQMAASLYDMIPCPAEYIKPTGEWNETTISFRKGVLAFMVNGKKPVNIEVGGTEWNKLIAESKFKDMPLFAKNTKGQIALQDHGGAVWFRKIMVRTF